MMRFRFHTMGRCLLCGLLLTGCAASGPASSGAPACPRAQPGPTPPGAECPRTPTRSQATQGAREAQWPDLNRLNERLEGFLSARLTPPLRGSSAAKPTGTTAYDFDGDSVAAEPPGFPVPALPPGAPAALQTFSTAWTQAAGHMKAGRYGQAATQLEALYKQVAAGPHASLGKKVLQDLVTALAWDGANMSRATRMLPGLLAPTDQPYLPTLYLALAGHLAGFGDHEAALSVLGHVLEGNPSPPEPAYQAHLEQVRIHMVAQRYDLALKSLSHLLALVSRNPTKPSLVFTAALRAEVEGMAATLHSQSNRTQHPRHLVGALALYHVALLIPAPRSMADRRALSDRVFGALSALVRAVTWTEPKAPPPPPCKPGVLCYRVATVGRAVLVGGYDKEILRRILRARLPEVRACYARELAVDPAAAGSLQLKFEIDPFGWLERIQVGAVSGTLGARAASLTKCITARAGSWRFPEVNAFYSRRTLVTYPIRLAPAR